MGIRLVIFISILIGIDFYAYQAIKAITKSPFIHVIYWLEELYKAFPHNLYICP